MGERTTQDGALAFVRELFGGWPRSLNSDDEHLVALAEKHGLLATQTRSGACGGNCLCAELFDAEEFAAGVVCRQKAAILTAK